METFTHLSKIIDPICDGKDSKKGLCDARTWPLNCCTLAQSQWLCVDLIDVRVRNLVCSFSEGVKETSSLVVITGIPGKNRLQKCSS